MLRKAEPSDAAAAAALAAELWPHHTAGEMEEELAPILQKEDAAVFLLFDKELPIGFAQCSLRHDYVEGTNSSPVGYLEGIYVDKYHRRRGCARLLLSACQAWGCREFASDCELHNEESLRFHMKAGFEEANRIICFTKQL